MIEAVIIAACSILCVVFGILAHRSSDPLGSWRIVYITAIVACLVGVSPLLYLVGERLWWIPFTAVVAGYVLGLIVLLAMSLWWLLRWTWRGAKSRLAGGQAGAS